MIDGFLQHLDTLLLLVFGACALIGAALMIVLRQPMRVAMALISTMVFLGGIYGLLGVHFIAAFQVLIYVGAVMVFMVYVIMLLEVRDSAGRRYSGLLWPGLAGFVMLVGVLVISIWRGLPAVSGAGEGGAFGIGPFSVTFLNGDASWTSSLTDLAGGRAIQIRVTMIADAETAATAEIDALGFSYAQ